MQHLQHLVKVLQTSLRKVNECVICRFRGYPVGRSLETVWHTQLVQRRSLRWYLTTEFTGKNK